MAEGKSSQISLPTPGLPLRGEDSSAAGAAAHFSPGSAPEACPAADLRADSSAQRLPAVDTAPTVISQRPPISESGLRDASHPQSLAKTLVGCKLGHFQLEEFVGGGGMGAVFRAVDTLLGRTVAVKVLSREQSVDEETVRRFRNEAQSAARLDHENVARVYFVGEDQGWYFIVFEFIEGENIRDLVQRDGPLPLEDAINYVIQISEALGHAAERNVVHRDIKPSNVLVTPTGRAKLVDMGLARLHQVHDPDGDLTASGVTLGTFDYISPEQARDPRSADVRSDIYSLGCTFFYMLTARPPFPEGTVLQKLLSHTSDEPPDPRIFRPDLPDEVSAVVLKMLAKQPAQRYRDPGELIAALLLVADRLGLRSISPAGTLLISTENTALAALERHLPWLVPVIVLILAVLAVDAGFPPHRRRDVAPPAFVPPAPLPAPRIEAPAAAPVEPAPRPTPGTAGAEEDSVRGLAGAETGQPHAAEPSGRSSAPGAGPPPAPPAASPDPPAARTATAAPQSDPDTGAGEEERASGPPARSAKGASAAADPRSLVPRIIVTDQDEPPDEEGVYVVDTLTLACRIAHDLPHVETIELRFNGPQSQRPLRLDAPRLTIRAADGFAPVLRFEPEIGLPDRQPRELIRLAGGILQLQGVQLEMDLPVDPGSDWALLRLEPASELTLQSCQLTLRGAAAASREARGASFLALESSSPSGVTEGAADDETADTVPVSEVNLRDCVVRGAGTLVTTHDSLPLRLTWHNGLLAASGRLLEVGGARLTPPRGERISVDLDHLTAVVDQGLCAVATQRAPAFLLPLDIRCTNSILVTAAGSPLVGHRGEASIRTCRDHFLFSGERNFYEQMDIFWRIESDSDLRTDELDFDAWRAHWGASVEQLPAWGLVQWQQLSADAVPHHQRRVEDYLLRTQRGNPALASSRDRSDVGFRLDLLPPTSLGQPAPGAEPAGDARDAAQDLDTPVAGDGTAPGAEGATPEP